MLEHSIENIFNFIDNNGIYTNITSGTVSKWTVIETLDYLDGHSYSNLPMRNAALPIFNINIEWVREFIEEYSKYSLIKDCIAPLGSSRQNHRQDQSILSILYYRYKDKYNFAECNIETGIKIHCSNLVKTYIDN